MTVPKDAVQVLKFLTEEGKSTDGYDDPLVFTPGETVVCPLFEGQTTYGRFSGIRAWTIRENTSEMQWKYMGFTPRMVLGYVLPQHILRPESMFKEMCVSQMTVVRELSHDEVRAWLPSDPEIAFRYALKVDRGPHDGTRKIVSLSGNMSLEYAIQIEKTPRDDARAQACLDPQRAVKYAEEVDRAPRDDTRAAALRRPGSALGYAACVDKCPRDDTRNASLRQPDTAYSYALEVDCEPRDDTRLAACTDEHNGAAWAYLFAKNIDKEFHPVTWAAVKGRARWEQLYTDLFGEQNSHSTTETR